MALLLAVFGLMLPPGAIGQSSLNSQIQLQKGTGTQQQQGSGTQLKKLQKGIKKTPATPAELKSVRVTPSSADAEAGETLNLSLRWTARLTPDGPNVEPVDLTSERGELQGERIAGKLAERDAVGNVTLSERIRVDGEVIAKALAAGRRELIYERRFKGGDGRASASVRIRLNGSLLSGVTATAAPGAVPAGKRARVTINWALDVTRIGKGSPLNIRSEGGALHLPDGTRLGDPTRALRRKGVRGRAALTEQISLSAALSAEAVKRGQGRVLYTRRFTDGQSTFKQTVAIDLLAPGGSGQGELALTRVDLEFADGSKETTVAQGKRLRAQAIVTARGAGRLRADWEVSGPPSTPDNPKFKTLSVVNATSGATGERRLVSPELPAEKPGTYLVRFVLLKPQTEAAPVIRYVVRGGDGAPGLRLIQPVDGGVANADTTFTWQDIDPGHSHRLEIFARQAGDSTCSTDGDDPVAGVSVGAGENRTQLSVLTRRRLETGGSYCWRVRALAGKQQVAVSDSRVLRWNMSQDHEASNEEDPEDTGEAIELSGFVVWPESVHAGELVTGRINLNADAPRDLNVVLRSPNEELLAFPDNVQIHQGRRSATFAIAVDPEASGDLNLTAVLGDMSRMAAVTAIPRTAPAVQVPSIPQDDEERTNEAQDNDYVEISMTTPELHWRGGVADSEGSDFQVELTTPELIWRGGTASDSSEYQVEITTPELRWVGQ